MKIDFHKLRNRAHLQMAAWRYHLEQVPVRLRWFLLILIAGVFAYCWDLKNQGDTEEPQIPDSVASPDTYIPAGFVLVPIQVSNIESLDSILGNFGVVDLFIPPSKEGGPARLVAEHIKILRAPRNPSQFAVLALEDQAAKLVHQDGAFFVVIQNPKQVGTNIVTKAPKKISRIVVL